jgi:threonine dehydrogenase-like Zn-dependent dehydrogenase
MAEKALGHVPISTGSTTPATEDGVTMKALVWHGAKDVRYEDVPKPKITHPKDALIRMTASTICGSDLHLYSNDMPNMHKGDVLGHESMGIIEDVGSEVKDMKVGDRVVISFCISCGECDYCKRGETTCCDTTNDSKLMEKMYGHRTAGLFGYSHLVGGYWGCQAEYIRVPFADVNLLKVPDSVPDDKVLYLSDVINTSYHATDLAQVEKGSSVAIWGMGPIGQLCAKIAEIKGAKLIICIDEVADRLEAARKAVKNIITINFREEKVPDRIAEVCPGGPDCAIDAAGFRYAKGFVHKAQRLVGLETDTSETLNEIFTTVRKCGRVSLIADYAGTTNGLNIGAMMEKHLYVSGGQSFNQSLWHKGLELLTSGTLDPAWIVTHRGTLADGPKFYDYMFNKKDGMIKPFLRPEGNVEGAR